MFARNVRFFSFAYRLALVALLALAAGCGRKGGEGKRPGNLLAGLKPTVATGVASPERITDGVVAANGDRFDSPLASRLHDKEATLVYDLGASRPIASVWLQGDNDDSYTVEVSEDDKDYKRGWTAPPANDQGLQERFTTELNLTGRYLRVRAKNGDGNYSLSEVQAFAEPPEDLPKAQRARTGRRGADLRSRVLIFGVSLLVFVFAALRRAPAWWTVATAGLPLLAGALLALTVAEAWPIHQPDVALIRGVIATVAALAVAREVFAPKGLEAHRGAILATLAITGVLGVSSFYNLWQPQFFNKKSNRHEFAHILDLRQYHATAKYFPEIGYRGIYAADVAAYLEDTRGATIEGIGSKPMRNLDTHRDSTVSAQRQKIEAIKQRFSPERWEAYKRDQRYLREAMGVPAYFEYMLDFGGNATPVWIAIAYGIFNAFEASDTSFLLTGSLDLVMLLVALVAIGKTFGPRTALLCATIFGANDFIMYGSNWAGATLRHDWMAYLAFGACALRRQRWALGGFFLALATLIRAFPGLALIALGLPVLWDAVETYADRRVWPKPAELLARHRGLVRAVAAGAVTVVAAVALTSLVFGASAWSDWYKKVAQLQADPHANHISLRSLIAGWGNNQSQLLSARLPVFIAAAAFFVAMVALGGRKKRPEQLAMLGLLLMPVFFYPANYYIHLVWLLPMLVIERHEATRDGSPPLAPREGWVWMTLLLMCAAQFFTTSIADVGIHFYLAGVCLFSAIIVILVAYVYGDGPELVGLTLRLAGHPGVATAAALRADEHDENENDDENDSDDGEDDSDDSDDDGGDGADERAEPSAASGRGKGAKAPDSGPGAPKAARPADPADDASRKG
jgi:glycosyl transferase family 87